MLQTLLTSLAVLIRILSNPLANVLQKQLTLKGTPPLVVNATTYGLLSFASLFLALWEKWEGLSAAFWWYAIAGGFAGALGNGFLVKALQTGDLSVLGPINSYKSIVGIVVGIFLLKEIPNAWGVVGVLLILYGSYFVLDTTEERFTWALFKRPEIQYRLWAMILTAIEAVLDKKVILLSSVSKAFISWCWFGAIFSLALLFIYKVPRSARIQATKIPWLPYLYLVLCIGAMQYTTTYVFSHMAVGYALAFFQLSILVSVFLGHKFFKEQDIRKKLVGSVIMVAGSVIILLLKNS